ncbi:acetate--CoA ligase family protein [Streptomyces sp. NPDC047981]|uniref:acetate--CoA ligase family protein n=1 Tax=Streptomyces sp. NPDC047981 TaxID=3154610 RepID=UPI003437212E
MSRNSHTPRDRAGALSALFAPRTAAVVGASNDTAKMGGLYFQHLLKSFEGTCYPVSRSGGPVQGVASYPSLTALPEVPDLVFVAVPAVAAAAVTKEAADLGVPVVVLHTAGFAETGEAGEQTERALTEYARARGTRLVGPNSMGIYGGATGANLLGLPARPGGVAFISASGSLIESIAPKLRVGGLGFRNVVGFENQADIEIHEYVEYCATDPGVDVIALYLEGIRNESGRSFVDALAAAARTKPVLVLRGAQTSSGQRSAVSHTAAIVSPSMIYDGLLAQAGVIEVEDESQLMPLIEALSIAPPATSDRVAIIGNGGGFATLTADAVERAGLRVPEFSAEVQAGLREALNPLAAVGNPVDAVIDDDGDGTLWGDLAEIILRDDIGAVLKFGLYKDEAESRPFSSIVGEARALGRLSKETKTPILVYSPYGDADDAIVRAFLEEGIPVVRTPRIAGRVLAASAALGTAEKERAEKPATEPDTEPETETAEKPATEPEHSGGGHGDTALPEFESLATVERLGLPVPARQYVSAAELKRDDATVLTVTAPKAVLKVAIDGIHHKSDIGGVRTGVSGDHAWAGARAMFDRFAADGDHEVDGIIVMEQVTADGPELLLSARRDAAVGPVVTVGAGGVLAELLKDVQTFAAPLSEDEALSLLDSLRIAPLLHGYRGSRGVDIAKLAACIAAFSRAFAEDRTVQEVEVNPLMTAAQEFWAVDAIVRREDQDAC